MQTAVACRYARADGVLHGRTGAVNQIQRFGSALNANTHFHALVLDGVFTAADALAAPIFHPATRVTDTDVAKILSTTRSRVLRLCRRLGLMGEGGELGASAPGETQGLLPFLCAASIQGRSALGSLHGARIERYGISPSAVPGRATIIKELCADLDARLVLGTPSLHAAVKIEAGRTSRLEHLCRYIGRPPYDGR